MNMIGRIQSESIFECQCNKQKKVRLTFDGGTSGSYHIELCKSCFEKEDEEFLISKKFLKYTMLRYGHQK